MRRVLVSLAVVLPVVLAVMLATRIAPAAAQTCTFMASGLNLGVYTGVQLTSGVGSVTATCTAGAGYAVGLNAGTGAGATVITRQATGPTAATLAYQMFQTSGRTTNWGNTSGVDTVTATSDGVPQALSIYPKVAAGQNVAPGTYTDTITASLFGFNNPTTTFTVIATIQPNCTIAANPLAFGTYTGSRLAATTTVTVTCTNTTAWTVGLDAGQAPGATVNTRRMTGPAGATLPYGLFLDSAGTRNWGLTPAIDTASGIGNGIGQPITVYGSIPEGSWGRPGFYADTITATVSY